MKIRTQLILSTIAFAVVLAVIGTSVLATNRQVEETNGQELVARTLVQEGNELSYLSSTYLLYGDPQQASRWQAKYDSFANDVLRLKPSTPQQRAVVESIKANQERLRAIFTEVGPVFDAASRARGNGLDLASVQVSWSRIEVQNQAMVSDASRLAQVLRDERDQLRQTSSWLVLVLMATFGVFLLTNYLLTHRRTLTALADLQAETEIVGSGNLTHSIEEKGSDEISDLCRAFNRMTANLREVTASKAQLEREVADRKRAEAELERLLAQLQEANRDLVEATARANETAEAEREARAVAERAVKARDVFMSIAAHELKTPVTSLKGFAQMLIRQQEKTGSMDTARVLRAMQIINEQTSRLARLTEQLLNLSRLEAGKQPLVLEKTDLSSLAQSVLDSTQHAHPERTIELRKGQEVLVDVDRDRMEQVITNLIDNAIKFSPPECPVEVEVLKDDTGWARVTVRDHGIGIKEENRGQLFQRFFQADPSQHQGGMGLGLSISYQMVEMHGGSIDFEQPEDGGSLFVVRLPMFPTQDGSDQL